MRALLVRPNQPSSASGTFSRKGRRESGSFDAIGLLALDPLGRGTQCFLVK